MTDGNAPFLGTGWSFPPRFTTGGLAMSSGEADVEESLRILFSTAPGERPLQPKYGLDLHGLQFEALSTTMRTLLLDRVRTAILIFEPRVDVLGLDVNVPDPGAGRLVVSLDYVVRATNSRFNLVYPFYEGDANELTAGR
jgi:phage baseplate assembly protein W